ncbi:MAG: hypothetical protein J1D87_12005 [Lachnospiraceae bacterium]|nr:hypothetical protein [Lachnospiraceae bacterium]
MAFAGLMFVWIILFILGAITFIGLLLLVIGIVLKVKKRKKSAAVLFVLSGLMLGSVLLLVLLVVMPKPKTVDTPNGRTTLRPSWIATYKQCLEKSDKDRLEKLVDRHPEMIYYYDANYVMLLDYGLYNCDIEIMQIALDHGAVFDEPLRYEHMIFFSSLDSFFSELDYPDWERETDELTVEGETTDKMIEAVAFAIENGAQLKWEVYNAYQDDNFLDKAVNWVTLDGIVSEEDEKLLNLIAKSDSELEERFEQMKSDLKKDGQTETDEESEAGQQCYETNNYKFYKADPNLLPLGTSKILGVYDLEYDKKTGYYYVKYDSTYQSLFIGQLLTLFGSADYVTENNEDLLSYVVAAEDEAGNVIYLNAYYGPSGPAIGGIANDEAYENAAGELAELIMSAKASDFELSSVYEDLGISLKMGVKDGQAYYDYDMEFN